MKTAPCRRACTVLAWCCPATRPNLAPLRPGIGRLGSFGFLGDDLGEVRVARGSKHDRVFATQELDGLPVLGAKLQAKFRGDRLVMVGSDWWPNLQPVQADPALTQASVLQALQADMAVGEGETWAPPT